MIEATLDSTPSRERGADYEIRVREILAGYGKKEVLRGISLGVGKGELLALIGPNGSGKSTFLKVLAGFVFPTGGEVCFDDQEITRMAPDRRVKIGLRYFMQGGRVFPNLTVKENLEMGAITVAATEKREKIAAVMQLFPHLEILLSRRSGSLSGGERQTLALAMLLITRPRLLLLDEPSAGLSPMVTETMMRKVHELTRTWGITVLLVEQNIRQALSICDRAVLLANGSVVMETNRPTDWLASNELEQFFLGTRVSSMN